MSEGNELARQRFADFVAARLEAKRIETGEPPHAQQLASRTRRAGVGPNPSRLPEHADPDSREATANTEGIAFDAPR
jgi:hypothetical protein